MYPLKYTITRVAISIVCVITLYSSSYYSLWLLIIYTAVYVLLTLIYINVTILPSNEALVYGSHWVLANLLYWYGGRMTCGRMVRSTDGSDARTKIAMEARASRCCSAAPRSMAQGLVGRSDMTWHARAQNVFDRLVVPAQPRCRCLVKVVWPLVHSVGRAYSWRC